MSSSIPMRGRLARWLFAMMVLAAATFVIAGRFDLPMVNAFLTVCGALLLLGILIIDPGLARERWRRGQTGEDPRRLVAIRATFLVLFVFALLDVGRLHWTDSVPREVQAVALAAFAMALLWDLWAVRVNRFFVPVIRIQSERAHEVVSGGPYALVRHPGYAGMIVMAPAAALAIGSWAAVVPGIALSAMLTSRAGHEDRFLSEHLTGYSDYAARVRFRLLPGVW